MLIGSILVAVAALVILPFWHVLGIGIFAALLFWLFHIHPMVVVGWYLLVFLVRWVLVVLGFVGLVTWASRDR
jgi:hypothetical protein